MDSTPPETWRKVTIPLGRRVAATQNGDPVPTSSECVAMSMQQDMQLSCRDSCGATANGCAA
jgi:hypothetical protein